VFDRHINTVSKIYAIGGGEPRQHLRPMDSADIRKVKSSEMLIKSDDELNQSQDGLSLGRMISMDKDF
jgi:hypothetical protein